MIGVQEVDPFVQNFKPMLKVTDREPGAWTYEDLCQLPQDGKRYEIIEGVLYVSHSPSWVHQETVSTLHDGAPFDTWKPLTPALGGHFGDGPSYTTASFTPDGKRVVTCPDDRVQIRDARTGKPAPLPR